MAFFAYEHLPEKLQTISKHLRWTDMPNKEIKYSENTTLESVVIDGFNQIEDGEGFEYIVGHVRGGKLKVVFEPDSKDFCLAVIDGVEGMGYTLAYEE